MEKVFIKEFKNGENIATIFILNRKEVKRTKTDKLYAEFTLIDKTGKIEARLWDNVEKYANKAETGDVVLVEGSVVEFRDEKQIKVDSLKKMSDGTFDYGDLVRVVEGRDDLFKKVSTYLSEIKNPWLKALVESFLLDTDFVKRFCDGVGAKSWHNAYIGGLLEHTYDVMTIVDKACSLYPEADRDMALFGAFLHDTGKIYELDEKKMEYTIEGGLIGHIVIGYKMLVKRMESIKDFPKDLAMRMEHIILSHHGEYEQQSPVLPKTLEATIVYHADELVSQANAIKEIKRAQGGEGKEWSNFITIKNRKYFIRDTKEESWDNSPA